MRLGYATEVYIPLYDSFKVFALQFATFRRDSSVNCNDAENFQFIAVFCNCIFARFQEVRYTVFRYYSRFQEPMYI